MKNILFLFTLLFSLSAFSQKVNDVHLTYEDVKNPETRKQYKNFFKFNSYQCQDGTIIKVGDTLYIGQPSVEKKQNNYNNTGKTSVFSGIIIGKLSSALLGGYNYLPASSQGDIVIVQHLVTSRTKMGKNSPVVIGVFVRDPEMDIAAGRSILNIDKALQFGEIISPNTPMSRDEAISKLKEAKDLFDLELMEEADYLKIKEDLTPIIMGK